MAIQEGPDGIGEKAIRTDWPVEEGLTAGSTKQTGEKFLHPQEASLLTSREAARL